MGHPDLCAFTLPDIDLRIFVLHLGVFHANCFPVCPAKIPQGLTVVCGEVTFNLVPQNRGLKISQGQVPANDRQFGCC